MFPIYLADKKRMVPEDDICYIVAKNGLFLKKKLDLIESLTPVSKVAGLEFSVVPYASMSLPKIPKKIFTSIFSLFRKVYQEYRSECVVLLFYNEKRKKFQVGVPFQKVTFTGTECIKMGSPEGYTTVASIHSHCSFSAFHSGTDITDEEFIEGLHITIGNVDEDHFSMVASIVSNKKRFKADPLDFINGIDEYVQVEGDGKRKRVAYLIVGGYVENYDASWFQFITGTKYVEPAIVYGWEGHSRYANLADIRDYQKFFKDREKTYSEAEKYMQVSKLKDPCTVCPFRKQEEPETIVEDLFFGYGE